MSKCQFNLNRAIVLLRLTGMFLIMTSNGICQKKFVYFKSGDYSLDTNATNRIDSLIQNTSFIKIILGGYCDSIGSKRFNDSLSYNRVRAVRTYLLAKNIPLEKIEIKAFGEIVSFSSGYPEISNQINRRVEIEMIRKDSLQNNRAPVSSGEIKVKINGVILDEKKLPLVGEVALYDKIGNQIKETSSGSNGKYQIEAIVKKNDHYFLTYFSDSSFVSTREISLSDPRLPYRNLKTVLPKLKKSKKYVLESINFESDTSQLTASSHASLEALYKLMRRNKSLVIRIEGHVNYPNHYPNPKKPVVSERYVPPGIRSREEFSKWLSEERAKVVYLFLVKKGIKPERLSSIGFGAEKMLFPDAETELEMAKNRRVEINVISY